MRIELLDSKWKEQRDVLEARKAQASELQRGANVVSSLRNLARTRVDIFGSETDEEREKKKKNGRRGRSEKKLFGTVILLRKPIPWTSSRRMSTLMSKLRLFIGLKV